MLGGVLKRIGTFDPKKFGYSFSQRLVLQKLVYLMKAGFGIDLGHRYNWYLHGPYSPDLARDAYALVETYDSIPPQRFRDDDLEKRFKGFLGFIRGREDDESWLELTASLLYLLREGHSVPEAFQLLHAKNSTFTPDECRRALRHLKTWGVVQ